MRRYLILAQSEATAKALDAWLELLGAECLAKDDPRRIIWEDKSSIGEAVIAEYESLVRRIESAAFGADSAVPLNEVVVLVDSVRAANLSAIAEGCNWDHLLALLILSFPDIHWVFGASPRIGNVLRRAHGLESLLTNAHREPLLDPSGLRRFVRQRTNWALRNAGDDLVLTVRKKRAAAIDEERDYAYLHGYVAYRFGCRVDLVTTFTLMNEFFGNTHNVADQPHGYWLLLEDMSLNFADKSNKTHFLSLEAYRDKEASDMGKTGFNQGRAWWFPKLDSREDVERSDYRILVTTGQTRPGDDMLEKNTDYLDKKKWGKGKVLFKPGKGMFGLWEDAGLLAKTRDGDRPGNVKGFQWPPVQPMRCRIAALLRHLFRLPDEPNSGKKNAGHGSPGKLMLVAHTLIRRSRGLLERTPSVGRAIQGAVLATEALELMGGRTPTSAMDALTLKHSFEVMGECRFAGVEYHKDTQWRLKEIALDTRVISRWFNRSQFKNAALNAEMHVLNQLLRIFRENNQFDEEQCCMVRVRRLHSALWMRQRPIRFLLWPLLWYLQLLLKSFSIFVLMLVIWVATLSLLFWWTGHHPAWVYGLEDAISGFFSTGPPMHHRGSPVDTHMSWKYAFVVCAGIVMGFIHLGVFISHLYSLVSRK